MAMKAKASRVFLSPRQFLMDRKKKERRNILETFYTNCCWLIMCPLQSIGGLCYRASKRSFQPREDLKPRKERSNILKCKLF